MNSNFEQISLKPGFMKHNGGLFFRNVSENEYFGIRSFSKDTNNTQGRLLSEVFQKQANNKTEGNRLGS